MICSNMRTTKALIRLRGCAGLSAPLLFANPEDRFSRVEAQLCTLDNFSHKNTLLNVACDTYPIFL